MTSLDRIANLNSFFVQQKLTPLQNVYRVSTVAGDGTSEGEPLLSVKQKRLQIREEIEIFDASEQQLMLRVKARKVFEFRGRSDVQLADGSVIGQLQKVFGASLFRSRWEILDASERVVAWAQESSMVLAIVRRAWSFVPILNNIPFFIPFHFDVMVGDRHVGTYRRIPAIADRYVMDLSGDTERLIDRRVAVAFAIALDALQDR